MLFQRSDKSIKISIASKILLEQVKKMLYLRNPEHGRGGMAAGALQTPSVLLRFLALLFLESEECKKP